MKQLVLTILLLLISVPAHARIYIRIDEIAEKKFPIAIDTLVNTGERRDKKDWSHKISRTIQKDLSMTGLFEFIEPELFPAKDKGTYQLKKLDIASWKLLGVQGLVKGGFQYTEDGQVKAELYLYDPLVGQKLVGHRYTAKPKEVSEVAHHFADMIMEALTGHPGIFRTKIAFVSNASRSKEIYMMGIDGSGLARLTNDRNISLSPAWSPGGGKIAYTFYTQEGFAEIKVYQLGSRAAKQITHKGGINLSPTWMPNGRGLTLLRANSDSNLYNISLTGRILRRLTNHWGIDIGPSWSPGGDSLVFASERAGGLHLFRTSAGGGGAQRLTFVGYQNDNPAWSPDGEKIVFQGRDQGVWDLFIMNSDGSMLQRLTAGTGNNQEPTWAPNSQFLAFSSSRTGVYQIHMMTSQGENQIRIPSGGSSTQPSWGPLPKKKF